MEKSLRDFCKQKGEAFFLKPLGCIAKFCVLKICYANFGSQNSERILRSLKFLWNFKMKNPRKKVQITLSKFGISIGLTKRITYRYPINVLERLIQETEKRQPQDPTNYFLQGLKRSRVKYGCDRKFNRKRR